MSDKNCIFCTLQHNNPNILYKNEHCYVILDILPLSKGHLLVIPNKHAECLYDYEENELLNILPTIQKIVKSIGMKKFNLLQNNIHRQSVPHVHFHIIPALDDENCLKIDWTIVKTPSDYQQKNVKILQEKFKDI